MVDVVAFGAHPDDIEHGCGGILAKMAAEGKKIVMVDLTLGDKGSRGTPEIRRQESINSANVIGAERVFLDFKDCEVFDTYENRLKLVKVIRQFKPKLILAPLWKGESNHPDHLALGQMARFACRLARFKNILPELPPHRVEGIFHYLHPILGVPDFFIDISDHVEAWKKMLDAHASQNDNFPYHDWNLRIASANGVYIERPYAQGLVKGNPIIINDLMTIATQIREV